MSLDITITQRKKITCPKCGEVVGYDDKRCVTSGGRAWYPILEKLGYYVPPDQLTDKSDWYGKDMKLTSEQANEVYRFTRETVVYDGAGIASLIATAIYEGDDIVINADW